MTAEDIGPPEISPPTRTLVLGVDGNQQTQLLWIEGLLPLPIGSVINLDNIPGAPVVPLDEERFPNGRADAEVIGVRLWGALSESRILVLEVRLCDPSSTGDLLQLD